ncbi:MAG TPA: sialate O-acetylesterase [Verrucomicrobiae bacterium]|nr:sialate O-acetylesterase [Verrucomicrobiae bacterium]
MILRRLFIILTVLLYAANPATSRAEIRLPHIFGSHMVLQREKPVTIWGWAASGENINVQLGPTIKTTKANDRGEWKVVLPTMSAGGPYTLTVSGSNTVTYEDVMVGEVWLCAGQSNMEFGLGRADHGKEEIAAANHPGIRLLMEKGDWAPQPQSDQEGTWKVCTPSTVAEGGWQGFSAVAYFFGRELNARLGVTVGLIDVHRGGTLIELWTPPEGFAAVPALQDEYERIELGDPRAVSHQQKLALALDQFDQWSRTAHQAMTNREIVPPAPSYPDELLPPHDLYSPTSIYNGMIHPLLPFALRGVIWYQGESDVGQGTRYAEKLQALLTGWRTLWGEGDFPFYFVQIAPYDYGGDPEKETEIWAAQTVAANAIPNTGMVVINDLADLKNVHPTDKQDVGHRLALWALAKTYGHKDLVYSGPTFKSLTVASNTLRVNFDNIGGGLVSRDGKPLNWFEIIDTDDGGFVKADARIEGSSVVLSSPGVEHPVAMRFAWSGLAQPNLMNQAGLPAGAFRAGEMPKRDWLGRHVPEAKDYQVVYDLDLAGLGQTIKYNIDNHTNLPTHFDRVAYFLELQDSDWNTRDIYVSMDAFTADPGKIGIPAFGSGIRFQQNVTNLNVYSNVRTITTGTQLNGGNIEFWPNNYDQKNSANVPNASGDAFDFGDHMTDVEDGYGCLQIHNHEARQTLIAINHWREGAHADIGIGNQLKDNPDWTFAGNAGNYRAIRLRVLVRCPQN